MPTPRLTPIAIVAALVSGCATATPEPSAVPPPVIEVSPPARGVQPQPPNGPRDRSAEEAIKRLEHAVEFGILSTFQDSDEGAGSEEGAFGARGLGLRGTGQGGGEGVGLGGLGKGSGGLAGSSPVRAGNADVKGGLSKDIIHRIVRLHIPRIRHCYEKQLARGAKLEGRVAIELVIGAEGNVTRVEVVESVQAELDACVKRVVAQMRFPKPDSAPVVVRYPFTFATVEVKPSHGSDAKDAGTN